MQLTRILLAATCVAVPVAAVAPTSTPAGVISAERINLRGGSVLARDFALRENDVYDRL